MLINDKQSPLIQWELNPDGTRKTVEVQDEEIKIINNQAVLNWKPSKYHRVAIDNVDGIDDFAEIDLNKKINVINEYKVCYENGIIFFHSDLEGFTLNIKRYFSEGQILYHVSRIYYRNANDVVKTLEEMIEDGTQAIEVYGGITKAIADAEAWETSLNDKVTEAATSESNLNDSISSANTIKSNLDTSTATANTSKTNLDNSNTTAQTTKSELDTSIDTANTSKTNLDTSISNAATQKTDLDNSISNGNTTKLNIDQSISTANTSKANLDTSITNANTKKIELDTSITNVGNKKDELDNSITTANTTKTALDQSIADGNVKNPIYSTPKTTQQPITSFDSDTKDAKVLYEIEGQTLREELEYNTDTWAEWTTTGDVLKDSTGLELTGNGVNFHTAKINTALNSNTKYGILYYVASSTLTSILGTLTASVFGSLSIPKIAGNQKVVATTLNPIINNDFGIAVQDVEPVGNSVKLRDIRIFELPIGSQIELDFDTLSADELAQKYPFFTGVGHSTVDLQTESKNLFPFDTVYQGVAEFTSAAESVVGYIKVKPNTYYGGKVFESTLGFNDDDRLWLACARYIGEYNNASDYLINTSRINIANLDGSGGIILTDNDTNYLVVCTYGASSQNLKKNLYSQIMLTEGNVIPTTYQPYKFKTLQPNLTLRSVPASSDVLRNAVLVDGKLKALECAEHVKNTDEHTLKSEDHFSVVTEQLNVDYINYVLPANCKDLGLSNALTGQVNVPTKFETVYNAEIPENNIGGFFTYNSSGKNKIAFICEKGTATTVRAEIEGLLTLTYQIEPITTKLPNQPELWSYTNGRLIDDSTIKPKITYSFAQNDVAQTQGNTEVLQKHENHLEVIDNEIGILKDEITNNINQETVTLSNSSPTEHITAKQNGGLDIVVSGGLITNIGGEKGNCEDISNLTPTTSTIAFSNTRVFGDNSIEATSAGTGGFGFLGKSTIFGGSSDWKVDDAKHYFVSGYVRNIDADGVSFRVLQGSTGGVIGNINTETTSTSFIRQGVKLQPYDITGETDIRPYVRGTSTTIGQQVSGDALMLNEITADEYNNLTVDQLIAKYPYVNGAQPLLNPVLSTTGLNIFNKSQPTVSISPTISSDLQETETGIRLFRDIASTFSLVVFEYYFKPNTTYTLKTNITRAGGTSGGRILVSEDINFLTFTTINGNSIGQISNTFTTSSASVYYLAFYSSSNELIISDVTFDNLIVYEGTQDLPYEPYQGGQIIFPTELAKVDTYQDKLTYKDGVAKVDREVKHVVLDGSLDWSFDSDSTGFKHVRLTNVPELVDAVNVDQEELQVITNHNRTILKYAIVNSNILGADYYNIEGTNGLAGFLNISIGDANSGWGEDITPTSDEMKAFMNGWQMNNGTFGTPYNNTGTKTWMPLGDTDNTRAVTTVPTTVSPTIEDGTINHYELYYALAEPETEEIHPIILGDGVNLVEGQNTLTVKSGYVWEKANPVVYKEAFVFIADGAFKDCWLNKKPKSFHAIYKIKDSISMNDTNKWELLCNGNLQGEERAQANIADYDPQATYYVLYQALQENYNCQTQEAAISYEDNIRGAIHELIETMANNQSEISAIRAYLSQLEKRIKVLE